MRLPIKTLSLATAIWIAPQIASATIVQLSDYRLGEAGSVGASSPFTPLEDSISPFNDLTGYQGQGTGVGPVPAIVSPGIGGAPGSTSALNLTQGSNRSSGWYQPSATSHGLTDNWAVQFWYKTPDSTNSTNSYILHATGNSGLTLELNNNKVNILTGINTSTRVVGFGYTTNTWMRLTLMDYGNQVRLYNGDTLVTTASMTDSVLANLWIGFGLGGNTNRGASGTWDEMKVWSFSGSDSLASVEGVVLHGVPEPGSMALMLLGIATLGCVRRRRS